MTVKGLLISDSYVTSSNSTSMKNINHDCEAKDFSDLK